MNILIDTLVANGAMTLKQLIAATGLDRDSTFALLKEYRAIGKIEELRHGTGRPVEYQLTGVANLSGKCLDMVAAASECEPESHLTNAEPQSKSVPALAANLTQPAAPRRKPFSPSQLTGYHAKGNGTVTLFLDRRHSAKSITFTAQQLRKMADDAEAAYVNRKSA